MKKAYTLASVLLLASGGSALAQGTELFFSEYDEGAQQSGVQCTGMNAPGLGTEKAMEVYNPTTATVDLNKYSIRRYSNGSMVATEDERLQQSTGPNTLAPSTTFVMAHPDAKLTSILSVANQLASARGSGPNATVLVGGGPIQFNGDDAMALVRWTGASAGQGTPVIVDIFGIIGFQPLPSSGTGTGQWSASDPVTGAFTASGNQSLKRRDWVSGGSMYWDMNATPPQPFPTNAGGTYQPGALFWDMNTNGSSIDPATYNIAMEWEMYSTAFPTGQPAAPCDQSYADLGTHTYTGPNGQYGPTGLLEAFNNAISFYPNPTHGRVNVSLGNAKVSKLTVINSLGRTIEAIPGAAEKTTLDVSSLTPGLYFVRCTSADGKITIYKELVVQ